MTSDASNNHVKGPVTSPGIISALGELGDGAWVTEEGLAALLGCHLVSLRRAVKRGQLPPAVKIGRQHLWTAGTIRRHIERRLEIAAKEVDQNARKIEKLRP